MRRNKELRGGNSEQNGEKYRTQMGRDTGLSGENTGLYGEKYRAHSGEIKNSKGEIQNTMGRNTELKQGIQD